ncbi:oxygen-independent coproporphyrinogen III oxidase [Palleronia caenipelagi]|uniref:Coproporphyrinogen-III oxidase n=2 Tax=Palleronia caenipelagi TaxID=2489174 RepID=A0A547PTA8_9RHOB|nr:oxygen-independent coproporphyrinogen III oxidase [Palleronia caenipelagi]
MDPNALQTALLTARIPRYTSYPPADRFSDSVTPELVSDWMGALPADEPISLYAHIPFCRRLCWFCACRTQGTKSLSPLDGYLDHLQMEVDIRAALLPGKMKLSALHLGGGTPTILSPDRMDRLRDILFGSFELTPQTEVSVEIDPCECDGPRLDALMRLGLSRASVGVQDFDPVVQQAIGREQTAEQTIGVVRELRARGIPSVNVDLLYGLPYQTAERLTRTLEQVIEFRPERLALYGYAHVPWAARRQRLIPEDALPSPEERLELSAMAREILVSAGYTVVGIDHFAEPQDTLAIAAQTGTLRRNFQGYTTDTADTILGLGASAISQYPSGYSQNIAATDGWQRAVAAGQLPVARGAALTRQDRIVSTIIRDLMCDGHCDIGAVAQGDADRYRGAAEFALARLPGIGTLSEDQLEVSDLRYARLLASCFDPGVGSNAARYSQAS